MPTPLWQWAAAAPSIRFQFNKQIEIQRDGNCGIVTLNLSCAAIHKIIKPSAGTELRCYIEMVNAALLGVAGNTALSGSP
jgi:hypothetical protein